MLLAAADHYAGLSCPSTSEAQRTESNEVTIAILSESLGFVILCATAQIVRKNWPRARILLFGRDRDAIEDNLYDARIDRQARPEDLLAALLMLAEYPHNQRATPEALLADGMSGRLLSGSKASRIAESDPTKRLADSVDDAHPREMPSDEQLRQTLSVLRCGWNVLRLF